MRGLLRRRKSGKSRRKRSSESHSARSTASAPVTRVSHSPSSSSTTGIDVRTLTATVSGGSGSDRLRPSPEIVESKENGMATTPSSSVTTATAAGVSGTAGSGDTSTTTKMTDLDLKHIPESRTLSPDYLERLTQSAGAVGSSDSTIYGDVSASGSTATALSKARRTSGAALSSSHDSDSDFAETSVSDSRPQPSDLRRTGVGGSSIPSTARTIGRQRSTKRSSLSRSRSKKPRHSEPPIRLSQSLATEESRSWLKQPVMLGDRRTGALAIDGDADGEDRFSSDTDSGEGEIVLLTRAKVVQTKRVNESGVEIASIQVKAPDKLKLSDVRAKPIHSGSIWAKKSTMGRLGPRSAATPKGDYRSSRGSSAADSTTSKSHRRVKTSGDNFFAANLSDFVRYEQQAETDVISLMGDSEESESESDSDDEGSMTISFSQMRAIAGKQRRRARGDSAMSMVLSSQSVRKAAAAMSPELSVTSIEEYTGDWKPVPKLSGLRSDEFTALGRMATPLQSPKSLIKRSKQASVMATSTQRVGSEAGDGSDQSEEEKMDRPSVIDRRMRPKMTASASHGVRPRRHSDRLLKRSRVASPSSASASRTRGRPRTSTASSLCVPTTKIETSRVAAGSISDSGGNGGEMETRSLGGTAGRRSRSHTREENSVRRPMIRRRAVRAKPKPPPRSPSSTRPPPGTKTRRTMSFSLSPPNIEEGRSKSLSHHASASLKHLPTPKGKGRKFRSAPEHSQSANTMRFGQSSIEKSLDTISVVSSARELSRNELVSEEIMQLLIDTRLLRIDGENRNNEEITRMATTMVDDSGADVVAKPSEEDRELKQNRQALAKFLKDQLKVMHEELADYTAEIRKYCAPMLDNLWCMDVILNDDRLCDKDSTMMPLMQTLLLAMSSFIRDHDWVQRPSEQVFLHQSKLASPVISAPVSATASSSSLSRSHDLAPVPPLSTSVGSASRMSQDAASLRAEVGSVGALSSVATPTPQHRTLDSKSIIHVEAEIDEYEYSEDEWVSPSTTPVPSTPIPGLDEEQEQLLQSVSLRGSMTGSGTLLRPLSSDGRTPSPSPPIPVMLGPSTAVFYSMRAPARRGSDESSTASASLGTVGSSAVTVGTVTPESSLAGTTSLGGGPLTVTPSVSPMIDGSKDDHLPPKQIISPGLQSKPSFVDYLEKYRLIDELESDTDEKRLSTITDLSRTSIDGSKLKDAKITSITMSPEMVAELTRQKAHDHPVSSSTAARTAVHHTDAPSHPLSAVADPSDVSGVAIGDDSSALADSSAAGESAKSHPFSTVTTLSGLLTKIETLTQKRKMFGRRRSSRRAGQLPLPPSRVSEKALLKEDEQKREDRHPRLKKSNSELFPGFPLVDAKDVTDGIRSGSSSEVTTTKETSSDEEDLVQAPRPQRLAQPAPLTTVIASVKRTKKVSFNPVFHSNCTFQAYQKSGEGSAHDSCLLGPIGDASSLLPSAMYLCVCALPKSIQCRSLAPMSPASKGTSAAKSASTLSVGSRVRGTLLPALVLFQSEPDFWAMDQELSEDGLAAANVRSGPFGQIFAQWAWNVIWLESDVSIEVSCPPAWTEAVSQRDQSLFVSCPRTGESIQLVSEEQAQRDDLLLSVQTMLRRRAKSLMSRRKHLSASPSSLSSISDGGSTSKKGKKQQRKRKSKRKKPREMVV